MVSHFGVGSGRSSCGHVLVAIVSNERPHTNSNSPAFSHVTADEESPRKKHKKNKHKKRRAREDVACEEEEAAEERVMEVEAAPGGRPLTLKIKLGGKPVPTTASR